MRPPPTDLPEIQLRRVHELMRAVPTAIASAGAHVPLSSHSSAAVLTKAHHGLEQEVNARRGKSIHYWLIQTPRHATRSYPVPTGEIADVGRAYN